jgi:very-short-patch-repair endonuclease
MKGPVFKPRNTERARELRNQATPAEHRLWQYINRSQVSGFKFTRQMPIGPCYGDFACRQRKLIVELDGQSHDTRQDYDAARTEYMRAQGFVVVRFSNVDVFNNMEEVLIMIEQALMNRPAPTPPVNGRGVK